MPFPEDEYMALLISMVLDLTELGFLQAESKR